MIEILFYLETDDGNSVILNGESVNFFVLLKKSDQYKVILVKHGSKSTLTLLKT